MDKQMQGCIRGLGMGERRQLLISLLYVLKDLPKSMLDSWWGTCPSHTHNYRDRFVVWRLASV